MLLLLLSNATGRPIEGEVTDPAEGTFAGYRRRAKAGMSSTAETVTAPQFGEKLLPDPLPEPYQRPFTLVIELNEALAHLVWDKNIGWRLAARPGVKDFLAYLGKYYEIVLFADSPAVVCDATFSNWHNLVYSTGCRCIGSLWIRNV